VAGALADQRIRALATGFAADRDGGADRPSTDQAPPLPVVLAGTRADVRPSGSQPTATRQLTHETEVLSPRRPAPLAAALAKAARSRPRLAIGAATATALAAALVVILVVVAPQNSGQAARSVAATSLSPIGTLSDPSGYAVQDVAFSPDGKTIAGVFDGTDGHLDLWDLGSRQPTGSLSASSGSIGASGLAFDPVNAQSLAFGDSYGIELWSLASRHSTTDSDGGNNDGIVDVAFLPDGKTFAAANADGNVGFFAVETGNWSATTLQDPAIHDGWKTGSAQSLRQVAVSPSGTVFAVTDSLGNVYVWNGTGGTPQRIRGTVTDSIHVLAFSPDSKLLAIASQASVQLLNVATGTVSVLRGPGASARAVAFNPQGTTLAVADAQGKIYLWRLATRTEIAASVPAAPWAGLAFSPDGSTLAAFGLHGTEVYLYGVTYAAS
jgi:WD40 repeat protein